VRLLLWLILALTACVLMHARLAAWPVAPDLPLALAAWAVVVGDARVCMWRVWLIGPVRDAIDPGSQWFHAGAHLVLILALLPTRRWLPGLPWLALLVTGSGLSLAVQGLDILVGGRGGWTLLIGASDALLTGLAAVIFGHFVPGPKHTVVVEEAPADEPADSQPLRSTGS
jgi:hypothetical protein